jgi:hypothetical protein
MTPKQLTEKTAQFAALRMDLDLLQSNLNKGTKGEWAEKKKVFDAKMEEIISIQKEIKEAK